MVGVSMRHLQYVPMTKMDVNTNGMQSVARHQGMMTVDTRLVQVREKKAVTPMAPSLTRSNKWRTEGGRRRMGCEGTRFAQTDTVGVVDKIMAAR